MALTIKGDTGILTTKLNAYSLVDVPTSMFSKSRVLTITQWGHPTSTSASSMFLTHTAVVL